MSQQVAMLSLQAPFPVLVTAAGDRAGILFLGFLASTVHNPHTRRPYARAASGFLGWCAVVGASSITAIQPQHVATWIELQTQTWPAATVRLQLAAIRPCSTGS
ncbi:MULTISPECIES: site-specific integrase [Paraburkholderia]|uniref:site-specific integrase n=1 Tax=Paraburkholderia TaxID=1822464 RepID=UPI0004759B50|nr:hypothetical protein [Paraburkholderia sp. WSM4179]